MKVYIRWYVNERYDVVIVVEMKEVFELYGGIIGCRVVVVKINMVNEIGGINKFKGISKLNNFEFIEVGICVWCVY